MIVDDALFMRKIYGDMLSRNQITVVAEAANGYEAIERYRETKPDVVVLDITMPGMQGLEALEEIIKIDPAAKIIMSSAMGQEIFVQKSMERGAKAFVVKPVVEGTLIGTIRSVAQE